MAKFLQSLKTAMILAAVLVLVVPGDLAAAQIPEGSFDTSVVEGTTCPFSTENPFWGVCYPREGGIKAIPLPCWCGRGGPLNPFKGPLTLPSEAYPLP